MMEYVDLGLSVEWATCNLGAETPEETGHRFTSEEKVNVDVKIPTKKQFEELINNCTWKWKSSKDKGVVITGKNGNSIFLPAVGEMNSDGLFEVGNAGSYWSSTVMKSKPSYGYYLSFIYKLSNWKYILKQGVYSTFLPSRTLVIRPVK